jgi:prophage antirepressor-like protein
MKIENWNGHGIRFVERDGEWWAVVQDVCEALGHTNATVALQMVDEDERAIMRVMCPKQSLGHIKTKARKTQDMAIVSESGLYVLIIRSNLPEAKAFRRWVCEVIKELRKSLGLSGYEAFRMMDKEHQKAAMNKLYESLREPVKVDYIKANTIADKAVSNMRGFPKMVKKAAMDEGMLRDREAVLADTVDLMALNERFGLKLSVSEQVYGKYGAA